jgi:cysteine-rich repeat protein
MTSRSARALLLAAPLAAALAGCPEEPAPIDAALADDAAPGLDAPGLDAPGLDAPAIADDAPGLDAPLSPGDDAPPAADTSSGGGCGDGVVGAGEQCDDGNTRPGDGCDAACAFEPTPSCGDGRTDRPAEECDDGNTAAGDGCDARCRVEAPASCGDGTLQLALGEECDDGNTTSGDGCSASCQLEPAGATCGDGTMDPGEVCDDGNTTNGDGCDPTCTLTTTTSVFAGAPGMTGRMDGVGAAARFTASGVLAADDRYLWMAEAPGMGGTPPAVLRRIEIATATVTTLAVIGGSGGIATNGVDTVWVAGGNTIQSISTSPPYAVTTIHTGVAAPGAASFRDGAPGTASFGDVRGLAWYGGLLWIVDTAAAVVRSMDPATGIVTTVAGMPYMTGAGLDGIGGAARFTSPRYVVSDNSGTLYVSDTNGAAIRAVNARTFQVTTFAGLPGTAGYVDGVGPTVRIHRARAITADGSSVFFCEFNAHTIRQGILATGAVSTLVGTADTAMGSTGGYAEGVGTAALLASPWGIVYHPPTGSIFFSDASRTIRRIQ